MGNLLILLVMAHASICLDSMVPTHAYGKRGARITSSCGVLSLLCGFYLLLRCLKGLLPSGWTQSNAGFEMQSGKNFADCCSADFVAINITHRYVDCTRSLRLIQWKTMLRNSLDLYDPLTAYEVTPEVVHYVTTKG